MKDLSYFQLRAFLYPRERRLTATFKISELENVWHCTSKNVKRKLKKFEEEGQLIYQPGSGRGNPSVVIFKNSFQQEVEWEVHRSIQDDQLENIMHLLQLPIPKLWVAKASKDVQLLFGFHSPSETKDVLRTMISREITTLDPLYCSVTFESHIIHQLGDSLVMYKPEEDSVVPHIAHHWKADDTYRVWTFYLRKGVLFHHHRTLMSEDVKFTFERFKTASSPYHWFVQDLSHIECPSPFIVRFHLREPNPFFLRVVSSINLAILPGDLPFDPHHWIGTGPYKLKEWDDKKLVLEAFDYYFLGRPYLDEIEIWRVPEETVKRVTYQAEGKKRNLSPAESEPIQKKHVENGFRFLAFNFNRPTIVRNRLFREALFHLIDMKKMWKDLGRKDLVEASSFFPWKSKPPVKDRKYVKPLLSASGYQGETLTLYFLKHPNAKEEAEWIRSEAKSEGIHLRLIPFTMDQLYASDLDREADLATLGEVASTDLHLSFLTAFYNNALLFRRFLAPEHLARIGDWLEEMKRETDRERRELWIDKVENYMRENHLILFLHHPMKSWTFHPLFQDICFESFGLVDFRRLWIE